MKPEHIELIFKLGAFLGAISTAGALGVLAWQTSILNTQFEEKDRPMIGFQYFEYPDNDKVRVYYTNFGSIANSDGKIFVKAGTTQFTRDSILTSHDFIDNLGVDLPNQQKHEDILLGPSGILQQARNGSIPLYLGVILKYNYSDTKSGEFGVIEKYSLQDHDFNYVDNWSK